MAHMRDRLTLSSLLRGSNRVIGTWTQIASESLIDALGHAHFDFTIIDCEHGAFGIETAERLIRACESAGLAPLARIPRGDFTALYKALDAGAVGVLAPGVESADEARELVAYTRFAPHGKRGACPIVRAAADSATQWQDFVGQQADCGVIAMIETAQGVERAAEICAVDGLKALLLGPFDLSVSMGLAGDHQHPAVLAALDAVITQAKRRSLPVVMPVFSPEPATMQAQIARWSSRGVRAFAVGADKIMVARVFSDYSKLARMID